MSRVIPNEAALEADIQQLTQRLWERMQAETPGVFRSDFWVGRLLDWSMQHPELKTDLFRLVDVLPALGASRAVQQHVEEYLHPNSHEMSRSIAAVFKLASGGLPSVVTAKAVQRSVREMALRFIVAQDLDTALPRLRALHKEGVGATVDLLGEVTLGYGEADAYRNRYLRLIRRLSEEMPSWPAEPLLDHNHLGPLPRANVSLKLSALEPHLDPVDTDGSVSRLLHRVGPLLAEAAERGVFVNIDMEQWSLHGITLAFLERALEQPALRTWPHIGIVVQAYTRHARRDLERLLALAQGRGAPITVRLVKGAYWDYEVVHAHQHGYECPVFLNKASTDANYEALSRFLLENIEHLLPAFGTHNLRSVGNAIVQAEALGLPPEAYEFQVLYGMAEPLRAVLRDRRHRVRVYAPVGELLPGMAYLVRRLLENTSNESFLRQGYRERVSPDRLLAKPVPPVEPRATDLQPPPDLQSPFRSCPHRDFTRDAEREAFAAAVRQAPFAFPVAVPIVVAGQRRQGARAHRRMSPNDGTTVVSEVQMATVQDAEDAVRVSMAAYPVWRDRPLRERALLLEQLAARLWADRDRLAALQVYEVAKPWAEADGDVAEAIDFCRYYARRALVELNEQRLGDVPGEDNVLRFDGRGPTAVIAPWNFPLAILCGMTTAALVSGNPVLMKPAEQSSAVGYALFEHAVAAGFPPDVLHFLPGYGEEVGAYLVEHPLVAQVAFTGSKDVGLGILERIGHRRPGQLEVKRAVCEMGGKNAVVIDDDADLDEAVAGVLKSAFGYAGQKCSAASRVIAVKDAHEPFIRRLIDACRGLQLAPAWDPACQLPPVVDEETQRRLLDEIERAASEGLVAYLGEKPTRPGYFVPPVVLEIQDPHHRLMQQELFGPILIVTRTESFEQALEIAVTSEYALTGAVFSRRPSHLALAREWFRVGNLYLNRGSTGAMVGRQPFAGFKMSGTDAKAGGPGYLLNFVNPRCVTENTMRRGFTPDVML